MTDDNVLQLPLKPNIPLPDRDDRDWVTSTELIADTGITYRQLDYWTRTGLITPLDATRPGSGHLHRFTDHELAKVRTVRSLLDAGVSLQIIRAHLDQILADGHIDLGHVTITVHQEPA